jgi:hypothetical protein
MSAPKPTDLPGDEPVVVQPQPVAQAYRVDQVRRADGAVLLALQFSGPCGQWVVFFDPSGGEALADTLKTAAAQARTGLHLPPSNGLHRG